MIIMLMQNLDIADGMCNGACEVVTELCYKVTKAKIITGEKLEKKFFFVSVASCQIIQNVQLEDKRQRKSHRITNKNDA